MIGGGATGAGCALDAVSRGECLKLRYLTSLPPNAKRELPCFAENYVFIKTLTVHFLLLFYSILLICVLREGRRGGSWSLLSGSQGAFVGAWW